MNLKKENSFASIHMNTDEFLFAAAIGTIALTNKQHLVKDFSAQSLYPLPFCDRSNTDDQYNTTAKFNSRRKQFVLKYREKN